MTGKCKECDGKLKVIDVDDISLTVECEKCGIEYCVEPDGLGFGGLEWVEAMAEKMMETE